MFRYMSQIFSGGILDKLLAIRVNHPNFTIIEIDLIIFINQPHIISPVGKSIAQDHVQILFILENHVIKDFER
ncbi:hypothetical protein ES703_122305 [subsurface metagenome]